MIPKEKAEKLVDKFMIIIIFNIKQNIEVSIIESAKESALIAVDEILNEYPSQCPKDSYEMERHLYWQEVKQEIKKL